MRTFIIAEAGINHDGDIRQALSLVEQAALCGADAVKFQAFDPFELIGPRGRRHTLQRYALNASQFAEVKSRCDGLGVEFMASAFDPKSLRMLLELGIKRIKLGSGELTDRRMLECANSSGLRVVLSTGMATMAEVKDALAVLSTGSVTLLQCTSLYPTPIDHVNLRSMQALSSLGCSVGLSDHTMSTSVPAAAVALGATAVEKHLTLWRGGTGRFETPGKWRPYGDHQASLVPGEFEEMVNNIRDVELAMGSAEKNPCEQELAVARSVRKSLVARVDIAKGEHFTDDNLACKRPGTGVCASQWHDYVGLVATRSYKAEEMIDE